MPHPHSHRSMFSGLWLPIVTPFHQQQVDFAALKKFVAHMAASGIAGIVACGSTSEAASLSDDEQLAVLDAILEAAPGCPVMMGLSGANLPQVLTHQQKIQERRICGLLVPPPSYIKPSQAGLISFFTTIADAATVPLVLYNIPYRTGVSIELESFRTLARHDRIVALKDCGGDIDLTMQLIADGMLDVLVGEDHLLLAALCLGAVGAISASAHFQTYRWVEICRLVADGKIDLARKDFYRLLPMIRCLFEEPNPAGVKALLAQQGWMEAELRQPLQPASAALQQKLGMLLHAEASDV